MADAAMTANEQSPSESTLSPGNDVSEDPVLSIEAAPLSSISQDANTTEESSAEIFAGADIEKDLSSPLDLDNSVHSVPDFSLALRVLRSQHINTEMETEMEAAG